MFLSDLVIFIYSLHYTGPCHTVKASRAGQAFDTARPRLYDTKPLEYLAGPILRLARNATV